MNPITIPVKVDTKTFRNFAVFDTLIRKKRWKSPALFAAIFLCFAAVCFSLHGRAEQAVLLGSVLAGVAIVLPTVYFITFFHSITLQARSMKLQKPQHAYTVELTDAADGIRVVSAKDESVSVRHQWNAVHAVYRADGCIYLFVSPEQAFLLPDGQAIAADTQAAAASEQTAAAGTPKTLSQEELWNVLGGHIIAGKMKDIRRKK